MKKLLLLFIVLSSVMNESQAQFTRYVVKLKNKGGTPFSFSSPLAYLSQKAIDRRTKYGIAIDSTDLPVTPAYLTQIRNVPNVTVLNASRWLNSITILTNDANAITTINGFSFVQSVNGIAAKNADAPAPATVDKFGPEGVITAVEPSLIESITADYFNYGAGSYNEIHLHNGEFMHNIGMRGQGMVITVLDGGFQNYTTLKAFDSINLNGQVLSTWDFVARNASVVEDHPHGMQCLSTIAANIPGQFIGKAPKASFHLFRTEDTNSEYPIEEHNWVCGAERADSLGSDVISSSLGYYDFDNASLDYTYSQFNGNTTMSVIGADLAAKKGLIVFNSIGNEGGNSWHFLVTPSDGDSVVAVGAVNTSGVVGNFSSYGPSSDGQIKPDMASIGVSAMVQATNNTVGTSNGTSFACPNMAGLGTLLWQAFPEYNNMKIIQALRQAGTRFTNPDDRVGYGIPNMKTAFGILLTEFATSSSTADTCTAKINWTSKDVSAMRYEIERKLPGQSVYTKVGEVNPSAGSILAIRSYQFINTVVNSPAGTVSYRIRQVIDTASASFTAVYIDTTNISIGASCFSNFLMNAGIISSNATVNACNATISWTSRDNGAMKYEIERKVPGETSYTKVAEVNAIAGSPVINHSYQLNNAIISPTPGIVSYRIRQIIDTAAASFAAIYIDTVDVTITAGCFATGTGNPDPNKILVQVQPNPVSGSSVTLVVETSYAVTNMPVLIYDMKGRLMMRLQSNKATGKKTIELNIDRLSGGKYFIHVLNGTKTIGTAELLKL